MLSIICNLALSALAKLTSTCSVKMDISGLALPSVNFLKISFCTMPVCLLGMKLLNPFAQPKCCVGSTKFKIFCILITTDFWTTENISSCLWNCKWPMFHSLSHSPFPPLAFFKKHNPCTLLSFQVKWNVKHVLQASATEKSRIRAKNCSLCTQIVDFFFFFCFCHRLKLQRKICHKNESFIYI